MSTMCLIWQLGVLGVSSPPLMANCLTSGTIDLSMIPVPDVVLSGTSLGNVKQKNSNNLLYTFNDSVRPRKRISKRLQIEISNEDFKSKPSLCFKLPVLYFISSTMRRRLHYNAKPFTPLPKYSHVSMYVVTLPKGKQHEQVKN